MSPKAFLVLITFALGAFLFWLTREQLGAWKNRKKGLEYGNAVLAAVGKHFVELKDKQVFLTEDKGYGVVDDSRWKEEVAKFIAMIVRPNLRTRIENPADLGYFHHFSNDMIHHLLAQDVVPRQFSVEDYLGNKHQSVGQAEKLLVPVRWSLSIAFAAVAVYVAIQQVWLPALLILLAGALVNPLAYEKVLQKAPWLDRFNIGLWVVLLIAVLSNVAFFQHTQDLHEKEQARIAEQELRLKVEQEQIAEQQRIETERKQKEIEAQSKNAFLVKRTEILDQLKLAIHETRFADAKKILDEYSAVSDEDLIGLKAEYESKKSVFDSKIAEEKVERERQENYVNRIRPYAIDKYTSAQYPKTVAKYRSRLAEIEKLRRTAAERAIDSGKCDYVENVQLSDESTLRSLKFFIDCANEKRIYLTDAELKSDGAVRTQDEKAWDEGKAIVACRQMVKGNAAIPSSVDFHSFTGTSASTAKTLGNVEVLLDFDAKNAFGAEIGYTARCIFPPQRKGSIEISLRQ